MRNSGAISITAVMAEGDVVAPKTVRTAAREAEWPWADFGKSAGAVAVTCAIAWLFNAALSNALGSVGMLFLVPVLLSAVSYGLRPALFAAFFSALCYNFFFLPPLYTLTIADPNNVLSFGVLLFVAIIAGNLAARVRAEANLAAKRAQVAGDLFNFSGKVAGLARLDDIFWAVSFQIASMLKCNVVILLPDRKSQQLEIRGAYPPEDELSADDIAAATWSWERGQAAGANAETLPGARRLFLPMRTGGGKVGVLGLQRPADKTLFTPEERRLLDALNDQTALAIERAQLVEQVDEAKVVAEADKLRVAMLTSLSHDLRTPLASVLGAATSLLANLGLYDRTRTEELLTTIREEAERLDRFVGNLLDMSRLEAGALGVKSELTDVSEVVDAAVKRLTRRLSGHQVARDLPPDLPFAKADPLLLEQALVNLLDNAVKFAPAGSTIAFRAMNGGGKITLTVTDEGRGIPIAELPHIFDKFYRARKGDYGTAGTGLGLSVARGFVEAFGGTLDAANRTDREGAVFTLTMPVDDKQRVNHGQ